MIRQAISCDICAAEKRQTNHWFVACEQGGELRISGWSSRNRLRPGSKHLCGQTCLHKLVDEFMAKSVALRAQRAAEAGEAEAETPALADRSLTAGPVHGEVASSARLLPPAPVPVPPQPVHGPAFARPTFERPQPEIVTMPLRSLPQDPSPLPADTLRYASRRWHAEAWERERERELRAVSNHPDIARRRSSA
jgi:hypothetical protein